MPGLIEWPASPAASFDAQPAVEESVLRCPELPASLALYFEGGRGNAQ